MKRRFALALVVLAVGCAKSAPRDSRAPAAPTSADAYAPEAAEPERRYVAPGANASFDELTAALDKLDADLSAQGLSYDEGVVAGESSTTEPKATSLRVTDDDAGRCERICDLRAAICDVAERICVMAEEHADDAKYADACTRAEARCEQATNACDNCES